VGGTPVQECGRLWAGGFANHRNGTGRLTGRPYDSWICPPAGLRIFSYRRSIFNSTPAGNATWSAGVDYALRKDGPANIVYADLTRYFAARKRRHAPLWRKFRDAVRSIPRAEGHAPGIRRCRLPKCR